MVTVVQIHLEALAHLKALLLPTVTRTHAAKEDRTEEEQQDDPQHNHAHDKSRLLVKRDLGGLRGDDGGGGRLSCVGCGQDLTCGVQNLSLR